MKCLNCSKEISDKAKYCSDKCRMAYSRRTKQGAEPEQNDPNIIPRTLDFELTRTDRLFEQDKPGYYKFSPKIKKGSCVRCGKDFTTHLPLLRFCSPRHMKELLVVVANGPHEKST